MVSVSIFVASFIAIGICLAPRPILAEAEPELLIHQDNPDHSPLITNGEQAMLGQFPWQAAIQLDTGKGKAFCGGSLISDKWVLTAAHCVENMKGFKVILGAYHLPEEDEEGRQVFEVSPSNTHVHPRWNRLTLKNDIALLELPTNAVLNDRVATISLASGEAALEVAGKVATISGWGLKSDNDNKVAEYLQYLNQPIISNAKCNVYYLFRIQSSQICMSGASGMSTCQGDSGGPLVVHDSEGNLKQIGIVSFGIAFGCEVGWPGVFTRVSSYLDYIRQITGSAL